MKDKDKFFMINVATTTLSLRNKHPSETEEGVIKLALRAPEVLKQNEQEKKILAVVSASYILKLKKENPKVDDRNLVQKFLEQIEEIFKKAEQKVE